MGKSIILEVTQADYEEWQRLYKRGALSTTLVCPAANAWRRQLDLLPEEVVKTSPRLTRVYQLQGFTLQQLLAVDDYKLRSQILNEGAVIRAFVHSLELRNAIDKFDSSVGRGDGRFEFGQYEAQEVFPSDWTWYYIWS